MKDAMLEVAGILNWISDEPDTWENQCLGKGLLDADALIQHIELLMAKQRFQWVIQAIWMHKEQRAVSNVIMRLVAQTMLKTWADTEPENLCNWLLDELRFEIGEGDAPVEENQG